MDTRSLGPLGEVSVLTLGGGGIGALWGETSREEGIATLREAVELGVTVLDAAPGYNVCEELIGEAFGGRVPDGVRVTTKCGIGNPEPGTVYRSFRASLEKSLRDMRLEKVDLFFLHGHIGPPPGSSPSAGAGRDMSGYTPWNIYIDEVIAAFLQVKQDGLIAHWGLTGVDTPEAIIAAVGLDARPAAIQSVTNVLDSPGSLNGRVPARPREIIAAADAAGVGVMGIRAVQAGALTAQLDRPLDADHPESQDYALAAPFRELCAQWGEDPAVVGHRYALAMAGVGTVILGVKNRAELRALAASATALEPERVAALDALSLRLPTVA